MLASYHGTTSRKQMVNGKERGGRRRKEKKADVIIYNVDSGSIQSSVHINGRGLKGKEV